jgi:hypothetical protein
MGGGGDISAANAEPEATAKANDQASKNLVMVTPMRETKRCANLPQSMAYLCIRAATVAEIRRRIYTAESAEQLAPPSEDFPARMHRLSRVWDWNHPAMLKSQR